MKFNSGSYLFAACFILASPAFTGDAPEADGALQEIIVTAQKREQSMQNVPITVAAVGANAIETQRIETAQDLQTVVPGLVYTSLGGYGQPYLRGIGSDGTQPNIDPSVATYVDGVYISFSQGTMQDLVDVDRVEVLKGPQGTLYGRNAVGGAINIITKSPTQDFESGITLGGGNYDLQEMSGYVSGGVTDHLAIGFYGGASYQHSYIQNTYTPGEDHEQHATARVKAVWRPTDQLKVVAALDSEDLISHDAYNFRQIQPNSLPVAFGGQNSLIPYEASLDSPAFDRVRQYGESLRIDYDAGFAKFMSLTANRQLRDDVGTDYDGSNLAILSFSSQPVYSRQWSEELQILSPTASSVQWIGGFYFFHENGGNYSTISAPILYSIGAFPAEEIITDGVVITTSFAGFGQATIPLVENLNMTIGVRYTHDDKSEIGAAGTINPTVPLVAVPNQAASWSKTTPKLSFDYSFGDMMWYVTYGQGFKAGAFSPASPTLPAVNPETVDAYELGFKSELLEHHLRLNMDVFYNKWKNIQVQNVSPNSGGAAQLQNAAEGQSKGLEAEIEAAIAPDFKLSANAAYTQSKYDSFPDYAAFGPAAAGNATVSENVSGFPLQRTPKFTETLRADYRLRLPGDAGAFEFSGNFWNTSRFNFEPSGKAYQGAYGLIGASATYVFTGERMRLMLWGANLADRHYYAIENVNSFGTDVVDGTPRTYGLSFTWRVHH